jgi:hypothetical protein
MVSKESPGMPGRLIRLAKGFYPVETKVRLLLTSDSLQFAIRRERIVLPLDEIKELNLEPWPSSLVAFALWILIPWSSLALTDLANLSVRTSSAWYHFKVRRRKDRNELVDGLLQSPHLRLTGVISTVES